ncbi:MAG: hypothetical protein Q7V05_11420 [Methanoregula sp.]|nr:hypothetical protein [Methanoregula sp.]
MSAPENKNPLVISHIVFESLDPFHRAAAEVLELHGKVVIEGVKSP